MALGAAMGRPHCCSRACAVGWEGTRMPTKPLEEEVWVDNMSAVAQGAAGTPAAGDGWRDEIRCAHHTSQRSGPERVGHALQNQLLLRCHLDQPACALQARHVHDEGVGGGPALEVENFQDCIRIESICAEPVDSLGGKRHQIAFAQPLASARDVGSVAGDYCSHVY